MSRDWIDALRARGGPLVDVARRFLQEHGEPGSPLFPRGADGLASLADLIDRWCEVEEPAEEADRWFVEGAGSLLGLLLIDDAGDGGWASRDGVHRVRLGPRGYCDPFAIVESALEADEPRASLALGVRRAEAEARGEGTVSRVVTAFEVALGRAHPGSSVREHFETYLRLDSGVEVDLSRAVGATADQSAAAVAQAVDKLVAMLPGGDARETVDWNDARPRLLPRLICGEFLDSLRATSEHRIELWSRPVGHDAWLALVLSYGDRARYVRAEEVEAWGEDPPGTAAAGASDDAGPMRAALENLAARSSSARLARIETTDGPLVIGRSGDGLDGSRLLLPGLHDVLAAELGSPLLVAAPHRDTLLACHAGSAATAEALRRRALDEARRAPHRITAGLFLLSPTGLEPA